MNPDDSGKEKRPSPAFQFYPDSWLSSPDIMLMTSAEEGAYIRLLCYAWLSRDCGLPDDDSALAELSRLRDAWPKSARRLRAKFEARDGRLFNLRLLRERAKQKIWSEKSREGGRKSAANRRRHTPTVVEPPLNGGSVLHENSDDNSRENHLKGGSTLQWLNSPSPSPSPSPSLAPAPAAISSENTPPKPPSVSASEKRHLEIRKQQNATNRRTQHAKQTDTHALSSAGALIEGAKGGAMKEAQRLVAEATKRAAQVREFTDVGNPKRGDF